MSRLAELPIETFAPEWMPEVDAFWRGLLGRHWNDTARERWHWLNPRRVHYLVRKDGLVLGNATLLRQRFVGPEAEPIEAGWITDFYVSPELKGRGMGKRLTLRMMEDCPNLATFGQSEAARYCFRSLGWSGPDWIPLFGALLPALSRRPGAARSFRPVPVDHPDLAAIWAARTGEGRARPDRSPAAMKERLHGRPDGDYEIWVADSGGGPHGWVVLRRVRDRRNRRFGPIPGGVLVDLFARDESTLRELARFGLSRLGRLGAAVVLAVATPGATAAALAEAGFRPGLHLGPLPLKGLPRKGFLLSPTATAALAHPLPLTFLDCDAELTF